MNYKSSDFCYGEMLTVLANRWSKIQRWARYWSSRSDCDLEDQDRDLILIFKITLF